MHNERLVAQIIKVMTGHDALVYWDIERKVYTIVTTRQARDEMTKKEGEGRAYYYYLYVEPRLVEKTPFLVGACFSVRSNKVFNAV